MINEIRDKLKDFPKPYVFCAGHTMGYFDKNKEIMVPLVEPFSTGEYKKPANMLRIINSPEETLNFAYRLINKLGDGKTVVLLNDTTHIPKDSNRKENEPNSYRVKLWEEFAASKLVHSLKKDIHIKPNESFAFWRESAIRDRFDRLVTHKRNLSFFQNLVTREFKGNVRFFDFKKIGRISYCRLSPAPDSITGGPDCVAEIIELCLEIFGNHNSDVTYQNKQIKNASLKGGTFVTLLPSVCKKPVEEGLKFYKKHFAKQGFEFVAIHAKPDFKKQMEEGNTEIFWSK